MRKSLFLAVLVVTLGLLSSCGRGPAYKRSNLSSERRTADLLRRMTLEEKIGQLLCPLGWPMYEKTSDSTVTVSEKYKDFILTQHGGMLWATFRADPWTRKTLENGLNPTLAACSYNELQRYAMENSRLGIPIILAEEVPHGHMAIGTTVYPTSIGLASTWDTEIITRVGRAIAEELRAQGGHIGYGPVIDLAREPRWSRVEETYGEDVFLTSSMAAAMVTGTGPKSNGYDKGIASTLKHFIAYGIPEGGHNGNPSFVGERDLRENFLPPFKAAVDAGALSIMTSYNAMDGVPTTANVSLLRGVLKDEWGFGGFVVSDLESIDGLCTSHHIASDKQQAAELALTSGVDVDLGANCYALLANSVKAGKISKKLLDDAVGRVLKLKFDFGLFDNPYVEPSRVAEFVKTPEHVALAGEVARESVILLENDGVLPLKKSAKVAVIGPNAHNIYNQLGDYTAPQPEDNVVTMLEGIQAKIGAENVTYVKGCAVRDELSCEISRAVAAAADADVVVAVVGGSSARDFQTRYIDTGAAIVEKDAVSDMESGEGYDRATLGLLGRQNELLEAVSRTGTPLVVVYIEGRPLDKTWAKEHANALLTLWYPGQEGGNALADVLFGDYNPAGRLPVSVPMAVGQLPVYYNKKFPAGHDYVEMSREPLYPFGYGLSYTEFEYSDLQISQTGKTDFSLTFTLTNVGSMDGEEVPQLYITDSVASVVRPIKQLRAFSRVKVPAGESRTVEFKLDEEAFSLYNTDMEKVVESGEFIVGIGAGSADIRLQGSIEIR